MANSLNPLTATLFAALFLLGCRGGAAAAETATSRPATLPAGQEHDQRMAQFRQAKYGLFVHWGLYAIPAGEWRGKPVRPSSEWIMAHVPIPVKEYEQLAGQFNPTEFNAERWVKMAEDAGMRYIVITAKHGD